MIYALEHKDLLLAGAVALLWPVVALRRRLLKWLVHHCPLQLKLFMPPPNVVWPVAYCFCPVRPCVCLETLLTRCLAEYSTHFHQTYINDALWDRDERFTIWGQKVSGQVYSGITMLEPSLHRRRHTVLDVSCRVRLSSS